jgi:hypothetical protein
MTAGNRDHGAADTLATDEELDGDVGTDWDKVGSSSYRSGGG